MVDESINHIPLILNQRSLKALILLPYTFTVSLNISRDFFSFIFSQCIRNFKLCDVTHFERCHSLHG